MIMWMITNNNNVHQTWP